MSTRKDTEVFNHKNRKYTQLRTAKFGAPTTRDNEPMNPGRMRYSALQSSSYSTIDAKKFYLYETGGVSGAVPDLRQLDKRETWASGPSANDILMDHVSEHGGYWSSPGARGCDWENYDGSGDAHYPVTLSMVCKNDDLKMIYNLGHGTRQSTNEGQEYGVGGLSGYITAYPDDEDDSIDAKASCGVQFLYLMCRCDRTEEGLDAISDNLSTIIEDLIDWLEEIMGEIEQPETRGFGNQVGNLRDLIKDRLATHGNDPAALAAAIKSGSHSDVALLKRLRALINGGETSFLNKVYTPIGNIKYMKFAIELINDIYQIANPSLTTNDSYLEDLNAKLDRDGSVTGGDILMTLAKMYSKSHNWTRQLTTVGNGILGYVQGHIDGAYDGRDLSELNVSDDDHKFAEVIKQLFVDRDTYDETDGLTAIHKNSPYVYETFGDTFYVSPKTIYAPVGSTPLFHNGSDHDIQIWQTDDRFINENSTFVKSETIPTGSNLAVEFTKKRFVFVCASGHSSESLKNGEQTAAITVQTSVYHADEEEGLIPDFTQVTGRVCNAKLEQGKKYSFLNSMMSGHSINVLMSDDAQPTPTSIYEEITLRPGEKKNVVCNREYVYYSATGTGDTLAEWGTQGLHRPIICEEIQISTPLVSALSTNPNSRVSMDDVFEKAPIYIYVVDGNEDNSKGVPDWSDSPDGIHTYFEVEDGCVRVENDANYDITLHFGDYDGDHMNITTEEEYNAINWDRQRKIPAHSSYNFPMSDDMIVVTREAVPGVSKDNWNPLVSSLNFDYGITAWYNSVYSALPDWSKFNNNITHFPLNKRNTYKFKLQKSCDFSVTLHFSRSGSADPSKSHPFAKEKYVIEPGAEIEFSPPEKYVYVVGHSIKKTSNLTPNNWNECGEFFPYTFRKSLPGEGLPDIDLPGGGGDNNNNGGIIGGGGNNNNNNNNNNNGGNGNNNKPGGGGGGNSIGSLADWIQLLMLLGTLGDLNNEGIIDAPIAGAIKGFFQQMIHFGIFGALKEADFIFPLDQVEPNNEYVFGNGAYVREGWIEKNFKDTLRSRFFNLSVHPWSRLMMKAMAMRHNGTLVHATSGLGGAIITGDAIKQVQMEFVTPSYFYNVGSTKPDYVLNEWEEMVPKFEKLMRFYDVREYSKKQDLLGVETEKVLALDQRVPYIEWETEKEYKQGKRGDSLFYNKAWFNPQLSRCIIAKTQGYEQTIGGASIQLGDMGARTDHRTKSSGMATHSRGPGLYLDEVFRDSSGGPNLGSGFGSKYWNYYNTTNSSHNWGWEFYTLEPEAWPVFRQQKRWDGTRIEPTFEYHEQLYPGVEFKLTNVDLNKFNSKLNDATNDWQINKIYLNFEGPDGKNVAYKAFPVYDHLQDGDLKYIFRNTDAKGTSPDTHNMAQLKEDKSTVLRLFTKEKIDGQFRFWGISVTAWIGNKGVAANWHAYNISNLKYLYSLKVPAFE